MNYFICVKLFCCILLLNVNKIESQSSTDATSEGSGGPTETSNTNADEKQENIETESVDRAMNDIAPKTPQQKGKDKFIKLEGKACRSSALLRSRNSVTGAKINCEKNPKCIGVVDYFCAGTSAGYCMKPKKGTKTGEEIVPSNRHCVHKKGK